MARRAHVKLGEFAATAIAGNDLFSSALYVSGFAALFAGVFAPLILLAVALTLFFYRSVYREVVGALPLNGGAYNALLNGASKNAAAVAGIMTVLSYMATAVISAKTAVEYLFRWFSLLAARFSVPIDPNFFERLILPSVIFLLFFFAVLVRTGLKESSKTAKAIFSFHLFSLVVFLIAGFALIFTSGTAIFTENIAATRALIIESGGIWSMLFIAFSVCLLGVSGFESSANFVEEQKPGVFPKTLRNMMIGVVVFNPLLAAVLLHTLRLTEIGTAKNFILAETGFTIGGWPLLALVAIDAFLVLSGAVLTAYVGIQGLVHRMSLDGCLPEFLSRTRAAFSSHPRVIWVFFLLTSSILLVTKGDLLTLAGVYTVSFLSVMTLFAGSNLILRQTREELKRPYVAPLAFVVIAFLLTCIALLGHLIFQPRTLGYFLLYFVPAVALSFGIMYRAGAYRTLARLFRHVKKLKKFFDKKANTAASDHVYIFVHHIRRLYRILRYVHENESGHRVTLIHCRQGRDLLGRELKRVIEELRLSGFFPHFKIRIECLDERFGPEAVDAYARAHHIARNKIFIGSIHKHHKFNYEEFGGVRIIL